MIMKQNIKRKAKLLLRLEAAMTGAYAVTDYKCWTSAIDMTGNCWASKRCEGDAVKYISKNKKT